MDAVGPNDASAALLPGAATDPSHDAIVRWLAPLMERLAALSAARPLLSGFYKIARAALGAANRAGASFEDALDQSTSSEGSTSSACRAFLLDVCAAQPRLSDELRASALQLVLSSPRGLLVSLFLFPHGQLVRLTSCFLYRRPGSWPRR